jgi:hypothetical protein
MASTAQALEPAAPLHSTGEFPLVRFVQALHRCGTLDQLGRTFAAGFGRQLAVPMFGFNVVHPGSTRLRHNVAVNVSDVFVTRYIREVMDDDPLRVRAHESGRRSCSATRARLSFDSTSRPDGSSVTSWMRTSGCLGYSAAAPRVGRSRAGSMSSC